MAATLLLVRIELIPTYSSDGTIIFRAAGVARGERLRRLVRRLRRSLGRS